jgi:membrane associated rhomboid family serine protease
VLPYSDNLIGQRRFGAVSWLVALLTTLHGFSFISDYDRTWIVVHLSFVPLLFSIAPWSRFYTLCTATFLHADIFHLLGNCLFLWVFGRSLEALFGSVKFLVVFPLLGVIGFISEWALNPDSDVPIIGASGAIAALMGAYLTLFPRARVKMIFLNLPFFKRFSLPAWVFLFYWIGLQVLSVVLGSGSSDHVAYAVHVGGFMTGVLASMAWKVTFPLADDKLAEFNPPTYSFFPINSARKF